MSGSTPELNLKTAVDSDDTADYLTLSLAQSLQTVDALYNNVTGHTHSGLHQGGPITSIPSGAIPDGSITSAKIADGTIATADLADGAVTSAKMNDTVWTTWTPQGNQSVTLTTTVTYAAYLKLGKLAIVQFRIGFTSAGTAAALITVSGFPAAIFAKRMDGTLAVAGTFQYYIGATGVQHVGAAQFNAAANIVLKTSGVANFLGNTPAVTAASGDFLSAQLAYEIA
jgi:hypothetical protein